MSVLLTDEETADIERREANLEQWIDAKGYRGKNGSACYPTAEVPENCQVSNDERSALEVRRFVGEKPDKYFLYIKLTDPQPAPTTLHYRGRTIHNVHDDSFRQGEATTWTGEKLGIVRLGREWRDSFGGVRVPVAIEAINGCTYHGTYYKSSGSYARVRKAKKRGGEQS